MDDWIESSCLSGMSIFLFCIFARGFGIWGGGGMWSAGADWSDRAECAGTVSGGISGLWGWVSVGERG